MARYAIYLTLTALLFGGGAWLWLSQPREAPAPAPAVVAAPSLPPAPETAPVQPVNPSFDVVRVAPDGRTVLAGRAAPGAEVTVRTEDAVVGAVTADKRGEWVLLPDAPLQPGTRELSLSSSDAGAAPREADATVVMVLPDRAADTPGDRAGAASPLAVLLPREGDADSRVLQAPAPQGDVSAAKGLSIDAVDFDTKGLIRPTGKAAPGAELRVYLDNRPLGVVRADERGQWSLRSADPAPSGQHSLRVDQLGPDGQIAARVEVPFTRAAPSLAQAKRGQIVVQAGNSLWRIARRTYGAGDRYTVIYQANKELIRDANKIYPGQVLAVPRR